MFSIPFNGKLPLFNVDTIIIILRKEESLRESTIMVGKAYSLEFHAVTER